VSAKLVEVVLVNSSFEALEVLVVKAKATKAVASAANKLDEMKKIYNLCYSNRLLSWRSEGHWGRFVMTISLSC
jgi:hypothetical protein